MNSLDPFEERLRQTPLREAPASLRREILRADRAAPGPARREANPIRVWLEQWSMRRRVAWATLGCAWVIILVLNLAALDLDGSTPPQRVERRISPALTAALREQRALRDSLLRESAPAALPSTPGPGAGLWWDGRGGRSVV